MRVRSSVAGLSVGVLLVLLVAVSGYAGTGVPATARVLSGAASPDFIPNVGQWPDSILFTAFSGNVTILLTRTGLSFTHQPDHPTDENGMLPREYYASGATALRFAEPVTVRATFSGKDPNARFEGGELSGGYYDVVGADRSSTKLHVPGYRSVRCEGYDSGVSAKLTLVGSSLRVSFQGDAAQMASAKCGVAFDESPEVITEADGAQIAQGSSGEFVRLMAPSLTADKGSTSLALSPVDYELEFSIVPGGMGGRWVTSMTDDADGNFVLANGGSGANLKLMRVSGVTGQIIQTALFPMGGNVTVRNMTRDKDGNVYVCGSTESELLPLVNPFQTHPEMTQIGMKLNGYLIMVDPTFTSILFSTYLGGGWFDEAFDVAVDDQKNIYVCGETSSNDFPRHNSVRQHEGSADAFVAKFGPMGGETYYSMLIGGDSLDRGISVAADRWGRAHLTGQAGSSKFPVNRALQGYYYSGEYTINFLQGDAYVAVISADGQELQFSSFLGGGDWDWARAIDVDNLGFIYVMGVSYSADFPRRNSSRLLGGSSDIFITKIFPLGDSLVYSALIGGSSWDASALIWGDMVCNDRGDVFVATRTGSTDFPLQGELQGFGGGNADGAVFRLSTVTGEMRFSTFVGGTDYDEAGAISVDPQGNMAVLHAANTGAMSVLYLTAQEPSSAAAQYFEDCCVARMGNLDRDPLGVVDITDLSALISHMFFHTSNDFCLWELALDGQPGADLTDLQIIIDYMFFGGVLADCPAQ